MQVVPANFGPLVFEVENLVVPAGTGAPDYSPEVAAMSWEFDLEAHWSIASASLYVELAAPLGASDAMELGVVFEGPGAVWGLQSSPVGICSLGSGQRVSSASDVAIPGHASLNEDGTLSIGDRSGDFSTDPVELYIGLFAYGTVGAPFETSTDITVVRARASLLLI